MQDGAQLEVMAPSINVISELKELVSESPARCVDGFGEGGALGIAANLEIRDPRALPHAIIALQSTTAI